MRHRCRTAGVPTVSARRAKGRGMKKARQSGPVGVFVLPCHPCTAACCSPGIWLSQFAASPAPAIRCRLRETLRHCHMSSKSFLPVTIWNCAWPKCGVDISPYGGIAMSAERKTGNLLWYPLEPDCPYGDHEWRVEREAQDAENTQALINFFRYLVRLPIRRDPKAAGDAVRASYLRDSRYSGPRARYDAYAIRPADAKAA